MPHWKSMMDRDFIFAFDLNGEDAVVTISRVEAGTLNGSGGRKARKPVVYFDGKEKGLALNSTNCKVIAKLYGNYTEKWLGKQITLYPTTTEMAGESVECIRVRPQRPDVQRPAQNGRSQQRKTVDVEAMIASYDGCDDPEVFDALEADRKATWGAIGKDDKLRVKAAAEQAHARVTATAANEVSPAPDAAEQAEIAKSEAEQS